MRSIRQAAILSLALLTSALPVMGTEVRRDARFAAELEGGAVWQSRNDVQIPNTPDATRFSLIDVQGNGPWPAFRLYLTWNISSRHRLRALAAPLSITETGELTSTTYFAGADFASDVPTDATYQFNSYRLTYAYHLHDGSRWSWWIGLTGKIRDAKIQLVQGETSAEKTDVGFVPLLYVRGWLRFAQIWRIVLDLDALAGGPGRAEDVSLKLYADLNERWSISAGYRTVEGGADVDEVYNFAWLHYAVLSVSYSF